MELSSLETKLLQEIQRDTSQSLADLSDRCGMAQSTVWRKLADFEKAGLIKGRVAVLDPTQLGCALCALASVTLVNHAEETVNAFTRLMSGHPQIIECLSVSGAADYHLKIRVADMAAYEAFMTRVLLRSSYIKEVHSSFVLREIKSTTELPIGVT